MPTLPSCSAGASRCFVSKYDGPERIASEGWNDGLGLLETEPEKEETDAVAGGAHKITFAITTASRTARAAVSGSIGTAAPAPTKLVRPRRVWIISGGCIQQDTQPPISKGEPIWELLLSAISTICLHYGGYPVLRRYMRCRS